MVAATPEGHICLRACTRKWNEAGRATSAVDTVPAAALEEGLGREDALFGRVSTVVEDAVDAPGHSVVTADRRRVEQLDVADLAEQVDAVELDVIGMDRVVGRLDAVDDPAEQPGDAERADVDADADRPPGAQRHGGDLERARLTCRPSRRRCRARCRRCRATKRSVARSRRGRSQPRRRSTTRPTTTARCPPTPRRGRPRCARSQTFAARRARGCRRDPAARSATRRA